MKTRTLSSSNTEVSAEDSPEIRLGLTRLLYRQAPEALGGSFIVALILAGFLWQVAEHNQLLTWLTVLLLVTILRGLLVVYFQRADPAASNHRWWGRLATMGAFLAGLCWGSVSILWDPAWPVSSQVLLILALTGVTAGAISSNSSRLSTFAAFMFPSLLPFVGILLLQRESAYNGLGLLLLLYLFLLFLIARKHHNTIKASLAYRFENISLLNEMNIQMEKLQGEVASRESAQAELGALNEGLERRVSERANDLQVLYLVSSILGNPDKPLEEIFQALLTAVLSAWSEHEETCARITFDDQCYQTENFQDGQRKKASPILINGEPRGVVEVVYLNEDGTVEMELFKNEQGSLLDAITHDISDSIEHRLSLEERQHIEIQLRQAQKLEAVGELAAGIAHEINTPTQFVNDNTHFMQEAFADYGSLLAAYARLAEAAVVGPVPQELLNEVKETAEEIDIDYLQEEVPQAVEQSLEGLGRIAKIVQAMKEFSHPGTKEKTPTDLNRAIETTIDVSRNEWKYTAELITELDPELPQVPVLPGEFNQVMLNLIVNAAHAISDVLGESREMGEIRIATRLDGEWAEITVSDSGKGIPEAIQKRIFDPFFTTKEVGKGSGQGLAIAWSAIVDKHSGTLGVESEEGEGAIFSVRQPITQGSAA